MADSNRRHGALRHKMAFQKRGDGNDGFGNSVPGTGPFETEFSTWAALRPLRGSEAVMADRLSGRQPYVLTVRYSTHTAGVTPAWRIVDANNRVYAITSPLADPDGKRQWLEGIVTEGVAS